MTTQRYERIPVFTPGDRMKKAREMAGLSQDEMAIATGISRGTVSHLERDTAPLKVSYLKLWSMATGVPVEWLESGDEPTSPPPPGQDGPEGALAELTQRKRGRVTATTSHRGSTRRYLAAA